MPQTIPLVALGEIRRPACEGGQNKFLQNRFLDRFWADLGLKFGFCVKNCIGTSVQIDFASCFENLLFLIPLFGYFFTFDRYPMPGSIKIERGLKKYPGGIIFRFLGLMGSSLVPREGPSWGAQPPCCPPQATWGGGSGRWHQAVWLLQCYSKTLGKTIHFQKSV